MSSKNVIFDAETQLHDGASAVTETGVGTIATVAKVLDLGGGGSASVGPQLPREAVVEVDVTAIKTSIADETYAIKLQVCNASNFASGVVDLNARVLTATGKFLLPVTNEVNGTRYRYMRIAHTLGGTLPSLTYTAGLSVR